MKNRTIPLMLVALLLLPPGIAHAQVAVNLSFGIPGFGVYVAPDYVPAYYHRHGHHRRYCPPVAYGYAPRVFVAPAYVVPAPIVVEPPDEDYPAYRHDYGDRDDD